MASYKDFLSAVRSFFDTNGFLKFLLSIHIAVFAVGGGLFVLGSFLYGFAGNFFTCIGLIIMLAGLLLTLFKEDAFSLVIISGAIALGSLAAFIYKLAAPASFFGIGVFFSDWFTPMFYFFAFGAIALVVFLKAERFKEMRAAAAARRTPGSPCPRCGGFVPAGAGFCPTCGAPATPPQYAPPPPQYAPPAQQYAPGAEPAPVPKCANCGADVPPGAAFCSNCGTKQ